MRFRLLLVYVSCARWSLSDVWSKAELLMMEGGIVCRVDDDSVILLGSMGELIDDSEYDEIAVAPVGDRVP